MKKQLDPDANRFRQGLRCNSLLSFEGFELGTSGIKILLEGADLANHRIQFVVHLTNADTFRCISKNCITVGVTEGEDGTRAVGEDFESVSIIRHHRDEAGGKRNSSNQGVNEAHLHGLER
jgi:hypothetical protein